MERCYLDNDVSSAISRRDLDKAELDAIDKLLDWKRSGKIIIETSRHSLREMERAPFQYRAKLKEGIADLSLAKDDHRVLGFHMQSDLYSCIACPLVTDIVDEQLYSDFRNAGLKMDDAQHLMYAVHNGYRRFLIGNKDFLGRRVALEKRCPSIHIQKPSEAVSQLAPLIGGSWDRALETKGGT
jgi:hypothetical protein